jgi:hypothetical protein
MALLHVFFVSLDKYVELNQSIHLYFGLQSNFFSHPLLKKIKKPFQPFDGTKLLELRITRYHYNNKL